jgi:hypothetical protein
MGFTLHFYKLSLLLSRHICLNLNEYDLIKETPKGYWIGTGFYYKKWIPKTSKKRFVYPTKEEALYNYMKRTEKRIKILETNFYTCKEGLELAKQIERELKNEKQNS